MEPNKKYTLIMNNNTTCKCETIINSTHYPLNYKDLNIEKSCIVVDNINNTHIFGHPVFIKNQREFLTQYFRRRFNNSPEEYNNVLLCNCDFPSMMLSS